MNSFFSQTVENLKIGGYQADTRVFSTNMIQNAIRKLRNHPSIPKIICTEKFSFTVCTEKEIISLIKELNTSKPNNI